MHKWGADIVEFHLDTDGLGAEFSAGHCWLQDEIGPVIQSIKQGFGSDGDGVKVPVGSELPDRLWRTDNSDGLRPNKSIRETFDR